MDEIEDFFNISKDFKRVSAPASLPKPIIEPTPSSSSRKIKREPGSPERVLKKPKLEPDVCKPIYTSSHKLQPSIVEKNDFRESIPEESDLFYDSDDGNRNVHLTIDDGVYDRYNFDLERDNTLPIHDAKDEILDTIRKNPVVILEGDTGCGKTTQVCGDLYCGEVDDLKQKNVQEFVKYKYELVIN